MEKPTKKNVRNPIFNDFYVSPFPGQLTVRFSLGLKYYIIMYIMYIWNKIIRNKNFYNIIIIVCVV